MHKIILIATLLFLSSLATYAQFGGTDKVTLPQLGFNNRSLEAILSDIDEYIGKKPNGLQYPITKIVFSQLEDLTCFDIVGIDNSWTDLFQFGEVPYGYIVIHNRLFLVAGSGYHNIDLTPIFFTTDKIKSLNKSNLPRSVGIDRNPTWFFEYKDDQFYLISAFNLDVLD